MEHLAESLGCQERYARHVLFTEPLQELIIGEGLNYHWQPGQAERGNRNTEWPIGTPEDPVDEHLGDGEAADDDPVPAI